MFKKLGVLSLHQPCDPKGANYPQDFLNFCDEDKSYFRNMIYILTSLEGFVASWEFAHFIYILSQRINISWLLMLRDPYYAVNSHANYRAGKESTVDQLAQLYNITMEGILQQVIHMAKKPSWICFDKYVQGVYAKELLQLFNIEQNSENIDIIYQHLSRKMNAAWEYKCQPSKYFKHGRNLMHRIKSICPELGVCND